MSRTRSMLYTKSQLVLTLSRWNVTEPLPPKGKALYVAFPNSLKHFEVDLAVIEKTNLKSDSGEGLWRVTTSSPAGREFDSVVQESHVVAYLAHLIEQYRRENQARYDALAASHQEAA